MRPPLAILATARGWVEAWRWALIGEVITPGPDPLRLFTVAGALRELRQLERQTIGLPRSQ